MRPYDLHVVQLMPLPPITFCFIRIPNGLAFLVVLENHHNRFTALFPGPPGWADARRELLDFMVQGKINNGRHTDHLDGHHSISTKQCPPPPSPIFYRPDALPTTQPTVLKHWGNECFYIRVYLHSFCNSHRRLPYIMWHYSWHIQPLLLLILLCNSLFQVNLG